VPEKRVLPAGNDVLEEIDLPKDNGASDKEPNLELVNGISFSKNQGTAFQEMRITQFLFFFFFLLFFRVFKCR
jgi:hypothetical protein